MPGLLGRTRMFDLKYSFSVDINGTSPVSADFATCSEISVTVGEATLWQGGTITPYKEPTRLTFADITLERGMSRNVELWMWFKTTSDAAADRQTATPPAHKRNGSVRQSDRTGAIKEFIRLFGMWPKEYSCGDFSNDSDEFRIERLVIAYDHFERVPLGV